MKNKNLEILNSLFQNTTMAISSLSAIIPKTKDAKLKGELQAQFDKYHQQNEEIRKQIYAQNAEPRVITSYSIHYTKLYENERTREIGIKKSILPFKTQLSPPYIY